MKRLFASSTICLPLILLVSVAFAQASLFDSLKTKLSIQTTDSARAFAMMELSYAYTMYYPDSCLKYALQAQSLAERLEDINVMFWAENAIHNAYYILGNYPKELASCYRAKAFAEKLNDPLASGFVDGMFSNYYHNIGDFVTSLKYYTRVERSARTKYPDEIFIVRANLSEIFNDMGQSDSALYYAQKAYEGVRSNWTKRLNNKDAAFQRRIITCALGNAYAAKGWYDSALVYYRRIKVFSEQADINVLDYYNGIASVYKATGQQDSAIWYAKKAIRSRIAKSYLVGFLKASTLLGDVYELQHKNDSALKYTKPQALRIAFGAGTK